MHVLQCIMSFYVELIIYKIAQIVLHHSHFFLYCALNCFFPVTVFRSVHLTSRIFKKKSLLQSFWSTMLKIGLDGNQRERGERFLFSIYILSDGECVQKYQVTTVISKTPVNYNKSLVSGGWKNTIVPKI